MKEVVRVVRDRRDEKDRDRKLEAEERDSSGEVESRKTCGVKSA